MGLFILFIPSRPYNLFPLSTLFNLCIKNNNFWGFFTRKRKEKTFFISGTQKETPFWKRGYFRITWKRKEITVYILGTRKETTFLKRGYFKKQKWKRERKVVSTISAWRSLLADLEKKFTIFQLSILSSCWYQANCQISVFDLLFGHNERKNLNQEVGVV